jgi:hypothetical protein
MQSGTVSDYNRAVANLQAEVSRANAQVQAAQAAQQGSQQVQAEKVAATCHAAGGQMLSDGSACVVSGVQDPVNNQGSLNAALGFPPVNVAKLMSECAGIG